MTASSQWKVMGKSSDEGDSCDGDGWPVTGNCCCWLMTADDRWLAIE